MENSKNEEWNNPRPVQQDNKKLAAGLLAILLGPLGIHKFLLGYTTEGIIWLVISLCTCGTVTGILGVIEGILYLTKSDEEFYQTYQVGKKGWFLSIKNPDIFRDFFITLHSVVNLPFRSIFVPVRPEILPLLVS